MNIDTETTDQAGTYARYSSSASSGLRNARCRATGKVHPLRIERHALLQMRLVSSEGTSRRWNIENCLCSPLKNSFPEKLLKNARITCITWFLSLSKPRSTIATRLA